MEKFYCVGCKQHYELNVHTSQRQPSKGGSFRHSLISECPKGHRVNKLCKQEVYETYSLAAEEGSTPVQDPMDFGEMANWRPLDGTPSLRKRQRAENQDMMCCGDSMEFHEDYFYCPVCETSIETEEFEAQTSSDLDCSTCGVSGSEREGEPLCSRCMSCFECCETNCADYADYDAEGMTVGVGLSALEPTPDEPETGVSMVPADSLLPEGSGHVIGSQSTSHNFTPFRSEVHDAETFIVYPELKNYLVSIMPDKLYNIKALDDGDFEMSVANRYMDDVIEAVSQYQIEEASSSSTLLGHSLSTVAATVAVLGIAGAWFWNKRK
jgi:hypothetical protein